MNKERIRKLKHQASLWCDENIPDQYSEETNGYGSAWEDKFAELLLKEAMLVCRTEWVSDSSAQKYGNQCADSIKQHFGVEL
jgi:hypothetical protein